jgi:ribosome maturation factor RimP
VSGGGLAPTFSFEGRGRAVNAEALVRPVVEGAGLELVEVSQRSEAGRSVLRVVVDSESGVDLDTISALSEKVSRRLDLEGYAPGPYALEVTSPGIERPLRSLRDYRRAIGQRVKVKTSEPVNGARNHAGVLVSAEDGQIVIESGNEELRLRREAVASARTVADWDAELKGSRG